MTERQMIILLEDAVHELKKTKGGYTTKKGTHWARAMPRIQKVIRALDAQLLPDLGAITKGGKSILFHDCTHLTDGLKWPAFDEMGAPGTPVLAPEPVVVYDNTSGAQGGDAFYCRGLWTEMEYWVAHIDYVPKLGAKFVKGQKMTTISADHPRPHVHLAINARPYIGRHLESHDDYTHGAPKIGVQLKEGID